MNHRNTNTNYKTWAELNNEVENTAAKLKTKPAKEAENTTPSATVLLKDENHHKIKRTVANCFKKCMKNAGKTLIL